MSGPPPSGSLAERPPLQTVTTKSEAPMSTPTTTGTGAPRVVRTRPRADGRINPTTEYSGLLSTVRDAGLLRRRTGFYYAMFGALLLALGGIVTGFVLLGDSWFQLLLAAALGIVLTQFAFLAHEASHRQVFESGKANDVAGRTLANLFVGISYSWWMTKHSRHHANPNVLGKDPDIERDVISFTSEDAARSRGLYAWLTRRQATPSSRSSYSRASTCTSTASAPSSAAARSTSGGWRSRCSSPASASTSP
ncbi:Fatty acid desaturase [Rathayibacter tanaceti]|uniref:Fatty acid desaturase n=1 Tax=Rathayibacter tanaceti TaxID=1671680 RepID=A0A162F968_9MICO|nr:Fatty acid desaturase [Rathayibacter tanaceti]